MEKEKSGYNLAGFDPFKSETLAGLRRAKYYDLEDLVYRMEVSYDEFMDVLDMKYTSATSFGYTLQERIYEISNLNIMLKYLPPDVVRVDITIDDVRLRSNSTTNKTITLTKK